MAAGLKAVAPATKLGGVIVDSARGKTFVGKGDEMIEKLGGLAAVKDGLGATGLLPQPADNSASGGGKGKAKGKKPGKSGQGGACKKQQ